MPEKSGSKSKKRIKPVIEEIAPQQEQETAVEAQEAAVVETPVLEEEKNIEESVLSADVKDEKSKVRKESKMNFKLILVITIISALVAAFVSGGVYVYLSGLEALDEPAEIMIEPTSSPSASTAPTPAPAEEIDISGFSVQVLNGSGAAGAASGGESVLSEAGFSVENTGNAGRYDYENTVVQVKSGVTEQVVDAVRDALESSDYVVEIGDSLPNTSDYDIVVIVGAN